MSKTDEPAARLRDDAWQPAFFGSHRWLSGSARTRGWARAACAGRSDRLVSPVTLPYSPPSPRALHGVVQVSLVVLAALTVVSVVHAYLNRLKELSQIGSDLETSKAELNGAQAVAAVGNRVYGIGADKNELPMNNSEK